MLIQKANSDVNPQNPQDEEAQILAKMKRVFTDPNIKTQEALLRAQARILGIEPDDKNMRRGQEVSNG